jgi:hypothetical protein
MLHVRRLLTICCVLAVALAFGAGPARSANGFFAGVDDLPLMPGLTQADGGALVFESPWGRIIEVYATGPADRRQVLAFYADTLPQLGWLAEGDGKFRRENETLVVDFPAAAGGPFTVRIILTPVAAPPP